MEIERKYHLPEDSVKDLSDNLSRIGTVIPFVKTDDYYSKGGVTVRIRSHLNPNTNEVCNYVTYKNKNVSNGIEFNDEYETLVEDPKVIIKILTDSGFINDFHKVKEGISLKLEDTTLDLSTVNNLGSYLEVEVISDDKNYAINKINSFHEILGLYKYKVESKSYKDLNMTNKI